MEYGSMGHALNEDTNMKTYSKVSCFMIKARKPWIVYVASASSLVFADEYIYAGACSYIK